MNMRVTVILVCILSLVGCTSMRPLDATQTDLATHLETGDRVVVYETGGRIVDMKLTQVDGEYLIGSLTEQPMHSVEVRIDEIHQIEVEKISGGKTAAAIIGGVILLPIAAVGFGLSVADGA